MGLIQVQSATMKTWPVVERQFFCNAAVTTAMAVVGN
jgi:hypothetical protein